MILLGNLPFVKLYKRLRPRWASRSGRVEGGADRRPDIRDGFGAGDCTLRPSSLFGSVLRKSDLLCSPEGGFRPTPEFERLLPPGEVLRLLHGRPRPATLCLSRKQETGAGVTTLAAEGDFFCAASASRILRW